MEDEVLGLGIGDGPDLGGPDVGDRRRTRVELREPFADDALVRLATAAVATGGLSAGVRAGAPGDTHGVEKLPAVVAVHRRLLADSVLYCDKACPGAQLHGFPPEISKP